MTTGVDPFVHEGLFYRDPAEYVTALAPFVEDGLELGEPVLVAVPGANLDLLRDAIGAAGAVRYVDMADSGRNPGRIIPGVLLAFATAHPDRRVRIIGEPIWPGRTDTEYLACAQHEALINLALAGVNATVLCPYDTTRLAPAAVADAARTHPVVVHDDKREPSPDYADPAALAAEFGPPLPDPTVPPLATVAYGDGDLPAVRDLVTRCARMAGLAEDAVRRVRLAVQELATNTIEHAGGTGTLRIWREPGDCPGLVCDIHDAGRLTDPLAGRRPVPHGQVRGRGLLLVNQLCDLVRLHAGADSTAIRVWVYG
ncbi:MAG: anti-sigma factor RsbA family regulatory protein [Mycobacteriales bacterium]